MDFYFFSKNDLETKTKFLVKTLNIALEAIPKTIEGIELYYNNSNIMAKSCFSEAISISDDNPYLYVMLGTVLENLNNFQDAVVNFKKALRLNNSNSIANYKLGMIHSYKGDFKNCINYLKIAAEYSEDDGKLNDLYGNGQIFFIPKKTIYNNIAAFLFELSEFEEAIKYADNSIELDRYYGSPYLNKGLNLIKLNRIAEAKESLITAIGFGQYKANDILLSIGEDYQSNRYSNTLNVSYENIPESSFSIKYNKEFHNENLNLLFYRIILKNEKTRYRDLTFGVINYIVSNIILTKKENNLEKIHQQVINLSKESILLTAGNIDPHFRKMEIRGYINSEVEKMLYFSSPETNVAEFMSSINFNSQ